jgi:hypothetical protein
MARPLVANSGDALQVWRIAGNILICFGEPTRGGPEVWGMGEVLSTLRSKKTSLLRNVAQDLGPGQILLLSTKEISWSLNNSFNLND